MGRQIIVHNARIAVLITLKRLIGRDPIDFEFGFRPRTLHSLNHSGESAPMIFDTMQHVYKMDVVDQGALSLKESMVPTADGRRACLDYDRAIGEKFA
jgi:hypothetical protein